MLLNIFEKKKRKGNWSSGMILNARIASIFSNVFVSSFDINI